MSSLILCNKKPFLNRIVTCNEKWILYDNWKWPAQWLDKEESPKHMSKPKLHQKRSGALFGDLVPIWSTTAFWIPMKPLHLRSMLNKSMRYTENCNTCSWHWSTERAKFFSTINLTSHHNNQRFRSWTNSATKFCLICHIHLPSCQPTTTSSSILTTFCKENASTTPGMKKMHGFLCHRSKQTYFSLAKMCWL